MNAPDKAMEIKGIITMIFATLTALWGWTGWAVIIWLSCMLIDYASGTYAAKAAGEWSSAQARAGLWHKLGEIFAVLVAALCDIALSVIVTGTGIKIPFDVGPLVTPIVLLWYIITELGSIVENAGKLGAPVPAWLKSSLKEYKEKIDHNQGGDTPPAVSTVDTAPDYTPRHEIPAPTEDDPDVTFLDERPGSGLLDEDD